MWRMYLVEKKKIDSIDSKGRHMSEWVNWLKTWPLNIHHTHIWFSYQMLINTCELFSNIHTIYMCHFHGKISSKNQVKFYLNGSSHSLNRNEYVNVVICAQIHMCITPYMVRIQYQTHHIGVSLLQLRLTLSWMMSSFCSISNLTYRWYLCDAIETLLLFECYSTLVKIKKWHSR